MKVSIGTDRYIDFAALTEAGAVCNCPRFAEQIDYTAWRCLDTSTGRCSEATNGGSLYSKQAFCALDPIDSIPNELYMPTYNNGIFYLIHKNIRVLSIEFVP